ncbi:proline iminopeptidase-family hydrolase [Bacillus tianshenii]|uniref:proline iminopeptidase-family hydrolase n=1 Tax=Sutcliffiella tianshenii TaxID=1463404 RepID=UPI001CD7A222|nr:proline iminopeptidase-family hydrolase [Bacillus tianshenii]MCA1322227.1 proline iminopeptidase-family hydrolase [Bacillus tianshenii]
MSMLEGFIEVTGGKVWYQKHEGKKDGVPVIVLHGGPGSSHYSLQGLRILAEDRPVIFYDQLGCGKSDRPTDTTLWNLERFVEELGQIKEALSLEDFHILGHSWGTTLAAAYYLSNPEGVKSIIYSSPCLSAPLWAEDQEKNRELLHVDVQQTLRICEENGTTDSKEYKDATAIFNKHFVCRLDPFPEFLKKGAHFKNPEVYNIMWGPSEFHVTGNLKDFDCTSELKDIHVPTLYTCGRYDEATPSSTEYFSSLTPNGKFHVFEQSAHMPYLEEPEEYVRVIGSFLKEVDDDK